MRFPMVQPVTEMTRAALGDRLAPGAVEYLDMFHEDAVFEFPFGADGPVQIESRSAMANYLASIEGSATFEPFELMKAYAVCDRTVVLEYRCRVHAQPSGTAFDQQYIAIIETTDGRIQLYREYLDPLNIPGVAKRASETLLDTAPLAGEPTTLDAILRDVLGDQLGDGADNFIDMFADAGVLECPFAPPGALRRLAGREAIAEYYERLTAIQSSEGMVQRAVYTVENEGLVLLEYEGTVRNKRDGGTYRQRYVAVVAVGGGRIRLFREYWNPLPVVASFGPAGPVPIQT